MKLVNHQRYTMSANFIKPDQSRRYSIFIQNFSRTRLTSSHFLASLFSIIYLEAVSK